MIRQPLRRNAGVLHSILAVCLAVAGSTSNAALAQQWASRAEYDLALEVRNQPSPEARLALIEKWKKQFPASPLAVTRAELALSTAEALGVPSKITSAANELIALDPNNFAGLYWITVFTPSEASPASAALDAGAAAARRLLETAGSFFASPAMKGTPGSEADHKRTIALAHRALAWAEWKRGNLDAARTNILAGLSADPQRADLSAWLGTILVSSQDPAQRLAAIWHLARAAFLDGDGALPSAERREVRALLEAAYSAYHGSGDGLDQIGGWTRSAVLPPDGFRIETAAEAAERAWEDKVLSANPELQPYLHVRRSLLAATAENLPQVLSSLTLPRMKGTVIACDRETRPDEIQIGVTRTDAPEVLLKLDSPMPKCPNLGIVIEFEGVLSAFTKEPYLVTLQGDRKAVTTVLQQLPLQQLP